jgi:hypothetical protein
MIYLAGAQILANCVIRSAVIVRDCSDEEIGLTINRIVSIADPSSGDVYLL